MADFFFLPQKPPQVIQQSFAFLKGESVIEKALARGKGVILISAHLGNWEFGTPLLTPHGSSKLGSFGPQCVPWAGRSRSPR